MRNLYIPTLLFFVFSHLVLAQSLPLEMKISSDGRRLTLGSNQTTGFYDDTQLKVVELEFEQPNFWNLLDNDIPATLTFEGVTYEEVGVRFKGLTSDFLNNTQKKSFNISLDFTIDGQDIEGYQTTNFNCGFQDPAHMREILYNWIGRHYNASLKTSYIHLKINGDTWGAYLNVQQPNKDFFGEWFLNDNGSRFRAFSSIFGGGNPPCDGDIGGGPDGWGGGPSSLNWLGPDTSFYKQFYTLKGSDRDYPWNDLVQSVDKLNHLPSEEMYDSLKLYFDVDKTLWFLAHEILFTDDDGYIYKGQMDYYLYFDDATNAMIPIEYDGNSVMMPYFYQWSPFHREADECLPLMHRLMQVPEFRQRYLAHCRTIINNYMDIDLIHNQIDFYASMIDELEANDPVGDALFSYNEFLFGVEELKEFFVDRRNFLLGHNEIDREGLSISNVEYAVDEELFEQPSDEDEVLVTATISNGSAERINLHYGLDFMGYFEMAEMFDDGAHGDGAANDGVYGAYIPALPAGRYVRYYIEAVKADGFGTRTYEPEGAEHDVYLYQVKPGEAADSDVVINELMASNDAAQADPAGEYDDWIELYNKSAAPIDLSGYYLSDKATNPTKWAFPEGTVIDGQSYLIIWADENGSQQGLHANFKLSKSGETVLLVNPGEAVVDQVDFGEQETDMGYARQPNGTGSFVIKAPTFNANNDGTSSTSVDINEGEEWLRVVPNPAKESVRITVANDGFISGDAVLQVFNGVGIVVYESGVTDSHLLDVAAWPRGMYFVRVGDGVARLLLL